MLEELHLKLTEEKEDGDIVIDLILKLRDEGDEISAEFETTPELEEVDESLLEPLLDLLEATLGIITGTKVGVFIDLITPTEASDDEIVDALATGISFIENKMAS